MNNAKRGQIPPYGIFFLFFISRVVVSLTYIQTICVGVICSDLLISIFCAFALTMILSIPAYLCSKRGINPIDNKLIAVSYLCFFLIKTSVNIARFTGFASSRLNPDSSNLFFAILIGVAVCYCAYLGIEGLSRFGVYSGLAIMFASILIIAMNIDNINTINLFPIVKNSPVNIFYNTLIMTSTSIESGMLLCLSSRINGNVKKAYFSSIIMQYATIFSLVFVAICVMGSNTILQPYPIFTLFQMATGSTLSRLDIFHTAFWILAAFVKCTLLMYCATTCIKKYSHKAKCVLFTTICIIVSVLMTEFFVNQLIGVSKLLSIVLYMIFCVVIPALSLLFYKKGEIKVENNS